ncbi:MAG: hypothetical protein HQK67_00980 [Desulfamplus sp.]|nr:hypothetical protein [Desulfamplus sp.]
MEYHPPSFYKDITSLDIIIITTIYKLLWRIRPCNIGEVPSLMEIFKLWAIKTLPGYFVRKM